MPLLDHFRPPLSRTHPWRAFHGAWAAAMARLLNAGVLPTGFYAVPFLDRDGPMEIDIAALDEGVQPGRHGNGNAGGVWAPPAPSQCLAVDWPASDDVSVEVFHDEGDPRLAAAIELVSPRNKDRPQARQAFAAKCVQHLHDGCGVVIVDVVTTRTADLHQQILTALGLDADVESATGLAATSYLAVAGENRDRPGQLRVWPSSLAVGRPLPTLPLWLNGALAVPLDLDASHTAACQDLRIDLTTGKSV